MSYDLTDEELVELAEIVLREAGYVVERRPLGFLSRTDGGEATELSSVVLVAHGDLFEIAIGATPTLDDLRRLEEGATERLVDWLAKSDLRAKQWDAYLVLLTRQVLPDDSEIAPALVAINYDTRLVRRLARTGVAPDLPSLRRALSLFLPLPTLEDDRVLIDALALLEAELPAHGADAELAARAIAAFREDRTLSSV